MQSGLDPRVLADLRQLEDEEGGSIIAELIDSFLTGARERLAAIRTEVAAGHDERVRFLAHALKGSSSVLGARSLAEACSLLEEYARTGLDGSTPELLDRLDREFERVRAEFASMRTSHRSGDPP